MFLSKKMGELALSMVVVCSVSACGSDSKSTSGSGLGADAGGKSPAGGGAPTIKISAPADGATVVATAANPDVDVTLAVTNFTLKAPGSCAGAANCGHVHLIVDKAVGDGTTCNGPGTPYNAAYPDPADPMAGATFGLDYCAAGIPGAHTVTAELHDDSHAPVKDATGATIADTIHVTVNGG